MPDDPFQRRSASLQAPASRLFEILPDDAIDLSLTTRAIAVGQSGYVRLRTLGGDVADVYIAAGVPFPIRANRVFSTGTTATALRGLA